MIGKAIPPEPMPGIGVVAASIADASESEETQRAGALPPMPDMPALDLLGTWVKEICEARTAEAAYGAIHSCLGKLEYYAFAFVQAGRVVAFPKDADLPVPELAETVSLIDSQQIVPAARTWSISTLHREVSPGTALTALADRKVLSGVTARLEADDPGGAAFVAVSHHADHEPENAAVVAYVLGKVGLTLLRSLPPADGVRPDEDRLALLSPGQLDILAWIQRGKSNSEIAQITNRTPRLVAYHVSEILKKLEVANRAQAAAIYSGREAGILD